MDGPENNFGMVQTAYIMAFALCEATAIFGLVAFFVSGAQYYYFFFVLSGFGIILQNLGLAVWGPAPVNLRDFELRYWFRPGSLGPAGKISQQVDIDYAAIGGNNVKAQIGPADQHGLATLRLQFADAAGSIKPYTSSGDIAVRLHRSDWSAYDQSGNFSYRSNTNVADWDHVTLYQSGAIVWGVEPPAASPSPSPSPSGRGSG